MKKRRDSRVLALQVLYALDVQNDIRSLESGEFETLAMEQLQSIETGAGQDLSSLLVFGVHKHIHAIDDYIEAASDNWTVHRLSVIDRNILRIAVFEIAFVSEMPPRVAINEAIEIAKSFSTDNSPKFINGVLDRIYRILKINSRGDAEQPDRKGH
ncbi:MAG TPA: transcription antitermination factor NusB [bacterium]|nr:transcription antitermination factor NusB [bacterium]